MYVSEIKNMSDKSGRGKKKKKQACCLYKKTNRHRNKHSTVRRQHGRRLRNIWEKDDRSVSPKKSIWLVIKTMRFILNTVIVSCFVCTWLKSKQRFFFFSPLNHMYLKFTFGTQVTNPELQQVCSCTPSSCPFFFFSVTLVGSEREGDLTL